MCLRALLIVWEWSIGCRCWYVADPDVLLLLASRLLLLLLYVLLLSEYCWLRGALRGGLYCSLPLLMLAAWLLIPSVHPSTLHWCRLHRPGLLIPSYLHATLLLTLCYIRKIRHAG
jgi:hypothetical protein